MVGTAGFEPTTACTPCKCATQAAPRPDLLGRFSRTQALPSLDRFYKPKPSGQAQNAAAKRPVAELTPTRPALEPTDCVPAEAEPTEEPMIS